MKLLLLLLALLPLSSGKLIKGKDFAGCIYPKEEILYLRSNTPIAADKRFTPATDEVLKAERILHKKLKAIASPYFKGNKHRKPVIYNELSYYLRQYAGIINEKGQHIIWINCLWEKDNEKDYANGIVQVDDGGSYYWNIEVNLDTGELTELYINGLG